MPLPPALFFDSSGGGYVDMNGLSGGERVRLCNPCVPDPNTAPPQSPGSPSLSPRSARRRSRNSTGGGYPPSPSVNNRYGGVFAAGQSNDPYQFYTSRTRSITMVGISRYVTISSNGDTYLTFNFLSRIQLVREQEVLHPRHPHVGAAVPIMRYRP